jgi:hypothetical protein
MSTDREFNDKWQRRIDGCGPYCSCLVTFILMVLIAIFLLQRCR